MKKAFFILISTVISFLLAEGIFRIIIFSDFSFSKELKDPGKYCIDFESDYWKLLHRFSNYKKLPSKTHPLLG